MTHIDEFFKLASEVNLTTDQKTLRHIAQGLFNGESSAIAKKIQKYNVNDVPTEKDDLELRKLVFCYYMAKLKFMDNVEKQKLVMEVYLFLYNMLVTNVKRDGKYIYPNFESVTGFESSCSNCKKCIKQDYGYSNVTVEGTTYYCLLNLNPNFPKDGFYGQDTSVLFGLNCVNRVHGEPIYLDVDGEESILNQGLNDVGLIIAGMVLESNEKQYKTEVTAHESLLAREILEEAKIKKIADKILYTKESIKEEKDNEGIVWKA